MCVNLAIVNGGRNTLYASDFLWRIHDQAQLLLMWLRYLCPGIVFRTGELYKVWNVLECAAQQKTTKVFLPGNMMIELLPNPLAYHQFPYFNIL